MSKPKCGAKTRSGGVCQQPAMENGRCRLHGGKSLKGIASPTLKTGRHSKYLPVSLMDNYHEHLGDDNRLVLDPEIALIDTRMGEVIESLGDYEGSAAWLQLYALKCKYQDAKNDGERLLVLIEIFNVIDMGASHVSKWNELLAIIDARRKVVESERKRLVEAEQVVTVDRVMLLASALLNAVKTHVTNPSIRAAIQVEFTRLVGATSE